MGKPLLSKRDEKDVIDIVKGFKSKKSADCNDTEMSLGLKREKADCGSQSRKPGKAKVTPRYKTGQRINVEFSNVITAYRI